MGLEDAVCDNVRWGDMRLCSGRDLYPWEWVTKKSRRRRSVVGECGEAKRPV